MTFRNTAHQYGLISMILHWGMALVIAALFALGLWMRSLDYYSSWYQTAPDFHKSAGMVLLLFLCARLLWRLSGPRPSDGYLKPWEQTVSHIVHWSFYALLFVQMVAGFLIATVDGRSIDVFGLISVPPVIVQKGLEDLAGLVHEYLAYGLIALAVLHGSAALKHHFIDHDVTLRRMWFRFNPLNSPSMKEKDIS